MNRVASELTEHAEINALLHIEQQITARHILTGPTVTELARLCRIKRDQCDRFVNKLLYLKMALMTVRRGIIRGRPRVVLTLEGFREANRHLGEPFY